MKTIIFGSRRISPYEGATRNMFRDYNVNDYQWMIENLDDYHRQWPISEVICGCALGADYLGGMWANFRKIPLKLFPYKKELGKRGGFARNVEMGNYADRGIAFWDGMSRGTKHMIDILENLGKPCTVWRIEYAMEFKDATSNTS